ncbi:MAG: DUF1592 domain-containing protein [Opitutaceae bacterium]
MTPRISLFAFALAACPAVASAAGEAGELVRGFCLDCHGAAVRKGGLDLEALDAARPEVAAERWEAVVRKLHHRQMPPPGEARPSEDAYREAVAELTGSLDRAAAAAPDPGRTDTLRRLNRTEYENAVRDLLALEIDATALLPQDEPSLGFDNVTVGTLSPALLDRQLDAARKVARLALGAPSRVPGSDTYRTKPDLTQEAHVPGLPLGTRGGMLIRHHFPRDGEYEVQLRLARDRNEHVEGLRRPHEIEVVLDRERVAAFTVRPPGADKNHEAVDAHLKARITVRAGTRDLGVTFLRAPGVLLETEREPTVSRFNMHRHPRTVPALYQVTVNGPLESRGPGETASRRRILGPTAMFAPKGRTLTSDEEEKRAREILAPLVRQAYRRPVSAEDIERPLRFFRGGRKTGGPEAGLEEALAAILVSPRFLFRVESDTRDIPAGSVREVTDLEFASRLSFFLWSSLPDENLLRAVERGELRTPEGRRSEVSRMLADPRARNLVTNFGAQWLHLRGLETVTPDLRLFIDFDDNLRQAMRKETELFLEDILLGDRSVLELISAEHTFLNERLARHYGVPHVLGSHFRRVSFAGAPQRQRGGLLRHGSLLTVTSYATRTSPVVRGHWILANLVGSPPPPPPPSVPALDAKRISEKLPIRARLDAHRADPACASCHVLMDPVGFALENFDAVGRWRVFEGGEGVDALGGLPGVGEFSGVASLEQALLKRPELFTGTLAEKLLIFALGRPLDHRDAPAIRAIVKQAAGENHRFSALILAIVESTPFRFRRTPP